MSILWHTTRNWKCPEEHKGGFKLCYLDQQPEWCGGDGKPNETKKRKRNYCAARAPPFIKAVSDTYQHPIMTYWQDGKPKRVQ